MSNVVPLSRLVVSVEATLDFSSTPGKVGPQIVAVQLFAALAAAAGVIAVVAAGGGYRVNQSAPVGSYPTGASPYGCMDMVGNAYEWCADWSKSYPGRSRPFDFTGKYHMVKGGCWDDGPSIVRCASRLWYLPPSSSGVGPGDSDYIGFRLAR